MQFNLDILKYKTTSILGKDKSNYGKSLITNEDFAVRSDKLNSYKIDLYENNQKIENYFEYEEGNPIYTSLFSCSDYRRLHRRLKDLAFSLFTFGGGDSIITSDNGLVIIPSKERVELWNLDLEDLKDTMQFCGVTNPKLIYADEDLEPYLKEYSDRVESGEIKDFVLVGLDTFQEKKIANYEFFKSVKTDKNPDGFIAGEAGTYIIFGKDEDKSLGKLISLGQTVDSNDLALKINNYPKYKIESQDDNESYNIHNVFGDIGAASIPTMIASAVAIMDEKSILGDALISSTSVAGIDSSIILQKKEKVEPTPTFYKEFRYKFDETLDKEALGDFFGDIYGDLAETAWDIPEDKQGYIKYKLVLEDENGEDITMEAIKKSLKKGWITISMLQEFYDLDGSKMNVWEGLDKPFMLDIMIEYFYEYGDLDDLYKATNRYKFKNKSNAYVKIDELEDRLKAEGRYYDDEDEYY